MHSRRGALALLFLTLGRLLSRLGFSRRRRLLSGSCHGDINPLQNCFLGGVALALVKFDDAGVSTVSLLLRRSDFGEKNLHRVFLVQTGSREAP